jgi:hypothetical protein
MQAGDVHRQDNAEVTAPFENDAKAAKKSISASLLGRAADMPGRKRVDLSPPLNHTRLPTSTALQRHSSLPTKAWGGICCYSVNGVELLDDAPKSNECWLLDAISKPCPMFYSRG